MDEKDLVDMVSDEWVNKPGERDSKLEKIRILVSELNKNDKLVLLEELSSSIKKRSENPKRKQDKIFENLKILSEKLSNFEEDTHLRKIQGDKFSRYWDIADKVIKKLFINWIEDQIKGRKYREGLENTLRFLKSDQVHPEIKKSNRFKSLAKSFEASLGKKNLNRIFTERFFKTEFECQNSPEEKLNRLAAICDYYHSFRLYCHVRFRYKHPIEEQHRDPYIIYRPATDSYSSIMVEYLIDFHDKILDEINNFFVTSDVEPIIDYINTLLENEKRTHPKDDKRELLSKAEVTDYLLVLINKFPNEEQATLKKVLTLYTTKNVSYAAIRSISIPSKK